MVSLFLVPEPRVLGANMLHLLEQAPVVRVPHPDPKLVDALEVPALPDAQVQLVDCVTTGGDLPGTRGVFHDHYIGAGPLGLDAGDPAEMVRLALLPEHPIGPRRIDDFQDRAVRRAMLAVYRYFGVDQRIPLVYHGFADPAGGWLALRTALA
jgi:hypothetical protein